MIFRKPFSVQEAVSKKCSITLNYSIYVDETGSKISYGVC